MYVFTQGWADITREIQMDRKTCRAKGQRPQENRNQGCDNWSRREVSSTLEAIPVDTQEYFTQILMKKPLQNCEYN